MLTSQWRATQQPTYEGIEEVQSVTLIKVFHNSRCLLAQQGGLLQRWVLAQCMGQDIHFQFMEAQSLKHRGTEMKFPKLRLRAIFAN
jgi:hypothetical protein